MISAAVPRGGAAFRDRMGLPLSKGGTLEPTSRPVTENGFHLAISKSRGWWLRSRVPELARRLLGGDPASRLTHDLREPHRCPIVFSISFRS
jgi:hypothetical protein